MASLLSNSTSALLAFQRALGTASHNIANATTEGYTRQRLELSNRATERLGNSYVGSGVEVTTVTRLGDGFLTSRLLDSAGELGRLVLQNAFAGRIDSLLTDTTTGLAAPWSAFFDAAQGVAAQPASQAARAELLGRAQALVARFDLLDRGLQQIDDEIDAQLVGGAEEVNRLTAEVVRLNLEIARQGEPRVVPDLLDQRDLIVKKLAELTSVTTIPQDDGSLNVFTAGGQPLVVGSQAFRFSVAVDEFRPDRQVLLLQTPAGGVSLAAGSIGGRLGAALESRIELVDPIRAELGRIATALAVTVNDISAGGIDLNGNVGTDFFQVPAPQPYADRDNTGTATLTASVADIAQLTGTPFVLRFDGANWQASRADNAQPLAISGLGTVASPLVVEGVEIVVAGAAAAGDRFRIEPTGAAASGIAVAINDPNRIAAASRVRASADLGNLGQGRIVSLSVDDASNPALTTPLRVRFTSPTAYELLDGTGAPLVPPVTGAYTPGGQISVNGWTLVLDGVPVAGDTFRVDPNVAGSSDNANMRRWGAADDARVLAAGANSMNDALSGLTTRIGSQAREVAMSLDSQSAINDGLVAERESLSGVNLDEEAANLLRFQQAYQAAAQAIATADTIFQTLLGAARR